METPNTILVSEGISDENIENSADLGCRILEVARTKFSALGYSRVSMSEIAQELRISKKTLYREFETKEDLLRAIIFPPMYKAAETTDAFMQDPTKTFHERLAYLMGIICASGERVTSVLMLDVYTHSPAVWQEVNAFKKKRMARLEELIQEGIDKGFLRKDIPAWLATRFYGITCEAMITPAVLAEIPYTGKEICQALISILFEGMLTDDARKTVMLGESKDAKHS